MMENEVESMVEPEIVRISFGNSDRRLNFHGRNVSLLANAFSKAMGFSGMKHRASLQVFNSRRQHA